jgi:hypothetical protein
LWRGGFQNKEESESKIESCNFVPEDKDLDCGGRAQRLHRFPYDCLRPKAAWRFASHHTPKFVVAATRLYAVFILG